MRIIIVGDGKVGFAIAEQLSKENHDVIIIDSNASALRKALEKLDVLCIRGSGGNPDILQDAGIDKTDLFIAVTSSDELNIICCLLAHKMGAKHTIVRVRNPEYTWSEEFLHKTLGIDMVINPESLAAHDISQLLRFPHAHSMETFAGGRLEMIEFVVGSGAPILGKSLQELSSHLPAKIVFCVVVRDGTAYIPHGNFVIEAGDHIHITGEASQTVSFAKYMGYIPRKVHSVMIIGGSRIAYYLAVKIHKMGMRVRIVEVNERRCNELCKLLPEAIIINGDGTDQDMLDQEGIEDMDAFVALTDRDEENILSALYAKDKGIAKIMAKVTRSQYARLAQNVSLVSPKDLAANLVVRYTRAMHNSADSSVERLYRIIGGQVEVLEFIAQKSTRLLGVQLKAMPLRKGIIVASIIHKGHIITPFGGDIIQLGDTVVIVTKDIQVFELDDILIGG